MMRTAIFGYLKSRLRATSGEEKFDQTLWFAEKPFLTLSLIRTSFSIYSIYGSSPGLARDPVPSVNGNGNENRCFMSFFKFQQNQVPMDQVPQTMGSQTGKVDGQS